MATEQVNIRLQPDQAALIRQVALRLKTEAGFAQRLSFLLADDSTGAPDDLAGDMDALRRHVAALDERLAQLEVSGRASACETTSSVAPDAARLVSQATYAREHDVSRVSVTKWKNKGFLAMEGDKVDATAADLKLAELGLGRFSARSK